MKIKFLFIILFSAIVFSCKKDPVNPPVVNPPAAITISAATINNATLGNNSGINSNPVISFRFSQPLKQSTVAGAVALVDDNGANAAYTNSLSNGDSVLIIQPSSLAYLTKYNITLNTSLESQAGGKLSSAQTNSFATGIDSSRKFPIIPDDELLTKVQQQTFKYFLDLNDSPSGMARERASDNITVTSGGTGFGIMAIPAAINRGFITRADGLARLQKIVNFLKASTTPKFHGAFSHWMNGSTGAVIPFNNANGDNGADLVETSYLMMGLLTARQYFNGAEAAEVSLRSDITALYNSVEWSWFRKDGKKVLYWNWSPTDLWKVNVPVQGWNECLITYVLAASSPTYSIDKPVYDSGYTRNGAMKNGNSYYNYILPLGENLGGPLFFEHYSFLGLNPTNLSDIITGTNINYSTQTKNHTLINYNYCKTNPRGWFGYSDSVWGLTASDIKGGYTASSPTNDQGFIAPTAAISSISYTPTESMAALKFYYYVLGNKLWGDYGFKDAFTLDVLKNNGAWFADSYLAIDQGPIIVMIENHRTGLLWNLFMSAPEVKTGLTKLGFSGF